MALPEHSYDRLSFLIFSKIVLTISKDTTAGSS